MTEKYLVGPISLSEHYSGKYDKHIYIFGDRHVFKSKCPDKAADKNIVEITNFLEEIITTNKDKLIDFYLETEYVGGFTNPDFKGGVEWEEPHNYMNKLANLFVECFSVEKHKCPYKNVRMHYTDLRHGDSILKPFLNLLSIYKDVEDIDFVLSTSLFADDRDHFLKKVDENPWIFRHAFKLHNIEEIKNLTPDSPINLIPIVQSQMRLLEYDSKFVEKIKTEQKDKIIDFLLEKSKINKQLKKIEFPEVKQLLEKLYLETLHNILTFSLNIDIERFKQLLKHGKLKDLQSFHFMGTIYTEKMRRRNMEFMDIYLLARIFRKFKQSDQFKKFGDDQSPKNILIYTGHAHADVYRKILESLGFITTVKIRDSNEEKEQSFQCLSLNSSLFPFFNKEKLEVQNLKNFFSKLTKFTFDNLQNSTKKEVEKWSKYCVENQKGNTANAKKILDIINEKQTHQNLLTKEDLDELTFSNYLELTEK